MLAELHAERDAIDQAILVLQRITAGRGRRRGRPPAWMSQIGQVKRRGRPPGSNFDRRAFGCLYCGSLIAYALYPENGCRQPKPLASEHREIRLSLAIGMRN